jgi:hypothetical protein
VRHLWRFGLPKIHARSIRIPAAVQYCSTFVSVRRGFGYPQRAFSASDPNDLPNVAVRIGIELRNQYVLAYSPKNHRRDGKYRRVEVKVNKPAGIPDLKVHWRLGYYAPPQ